MSMKLLIVNKSPKIQNPQACHVGLGVTANNLAEFLKRKKFNVQAESIIDGYDLRDKLKNESYKDITHVVICAPIFDTGFLRQLCNQFPNIQFSNTFHSNAGFLGLDKWAMGILGEQILAQKDLPNFKVSVNCKKFEKVVEELFDTDVLCLSNLYPIFEDCWPIKRGSLDSNPIRVGTFCAIRSLKNIPTAAFAAGIIAAKTGKKVEFCIMSGREEDPQAEKIVTGVKRLFDSIPNIELVQYDWAEWDEFRHNIVGNMDVLILPSFTESFNVVTADGIYMGVPSVVGTSIDWVPSYWIGNSDDAYDLADRAIKLIGYQGTARDGWVSLSERNDQSFEDWKNWLTPKPKKKTFVDKIKHFFKKNILSVIGDDLD